ncbi:EAL domain-containing protein [Sulfurovum sp.]|uniref:putative bifunctional diguanylate cyclase/phosphodiesterase n=1 Tax=Sulfurovum sp. TaxID=1969726 RepID=UPI0025CBE61B|nr:EAL domain-containing protein [Sulfurovum sp.]
MNQQKSYVFLQKQILLLLILSLVPGLAYIGLGWMSGVVMPALVWYSLNVLVSLWGWQLYKRYQLEQMDRAEIKSWYQKLTIFYYIIFGLWTVIFLLYAGEVESKLHYIAIFTQLGASVVASALLISERKLFIPVLWILMLPLIVYFALIGEWYGYILSLFSMIYLGVLLYASNNSNKMMQKNYYYAQHDALTNLYNRRYFSDFMDQLIKRIKVSKKYAYILLIDLDHFKTINDSLGHDVGDKLLQAVAKRIGNFCKETHTVARLGGDEFVIVSPEYKNEMLCMEIRESFTEKLLAILKEPYVIDKHHLYISASIGVNKLTSASEDASQFMKEADIAMYEAKSNGRDGIILFNKGLATRAERYLEIERNLYFALEHEEIKLHYQPQFDREERIIGCEVLVRWENSELGSVTPIEFIVIAEKTGLIIELGNYILEEAFKTLQDWDDKGIVLEQFSINISVRQFFHSSFLADVEHLCEKYLNKNTRKKIIFEVTETLLIEDIGKIVAIMEKLKYLGISLSMDDFGTGYSSLGYLREMPIDELKIDRSFVGHLGKEASDELMITTILSMAKIFDLKVVAEGVETEEQFNFLVENGCDIFQGFYFSKVLTKEAFEKKVS